MMPFAQPGWPQAQPVHAARTPTIFDALWPTRRLGSSSWHVHRALAVPVLRGWCCGAIVAFVGYMYRRDSVELRPRRRVRCCWRCGWSLWWAFWPIFSSWKSAPNARSIHNSRVIVLVDTSLSMGLHDSRFVAACRPRPIGWSKSSAVLDAGGLIAQAARRRNDVMLVRFDADTSRIASLAKLPQPLATGSGRAAGQPAGRRLRKPTKPPRRPSTVDWKTGLHAARERNAAGTGRARPGERRTRRCPVAGIVLFSDGGQNAGIDAQSAIDAARDAKIPVFTVGIGSDRRPANVRISDFVAPARAYPGDSFTVTGYLQSQELGRPHGDGRADFAARRRSRQESSSGKVEGTERVTLGGRGEVVAGQVRDHAGRDRPAHVPLSRSRRRPKTTTPPTTPQEADVEIVDRKTRGAAGRQRADARIHLPAQPAPPRQGNDRRRLSCNRARPASRRTPTRSSNDFPSTPQELFDYDAIVAFDPDWLRPGRRPRSICSSAGWPRRPAA